MESKIKSIKEIFNDKGMFITPIDPYRCERTNPIYQYLFDEDGYATAVEEAYAYIQEIQPIWTSDIIKYYYASECIDPNCKGNYSAIYAWRHLYYKHS